MDVFNGWLVFVLGLALTLSLVWLLWIRPKNLAARATTVAKERQKLEEFYRGRVSAVLAGLSVLLGLLLTAWATLSTHQESERTLTAAREQADKTLAQQNIQARESHRLDQKQRAFELMRDKDSAIGRIGGIVTAREIVASDPASQDAILSTLVAAAVLLSRPTGSAPTAECSDTKIPLDSMSTLQAIGELSVMAAGRPLPLTGGCFRGAQIANRNYNGANLEDADLRGSDLYQSHLYGVNLRFARLDGAGLSGSLLDEAGLGGATACFSRNLAVPALAGPPVPAQFVDAKLRNISAVGAWFVGAQFASSGPRSAEPHTNMYGADLRGAVLTEANFRNVELDYASLDGADLTDADFTGSTVAGVTHENAIFCRTKWADNTVRSEGCDRSRSISHAKTCPQPKPEEVQAIVDQYGHQGHG